MITDFELMHHFEILILKRSEHSIQESSQPLLKGSTVGLSYTTVLDLILRGRYYWFLPKIYKKKTSDIVDSHP